MGNFRERYLEEQNVIRETHVIGQNEYGRILFEPNQGVNRDTLDISVTMKRRCGWYYNGYHNVWVLRTPVKDFYFDSRGGMAFEVDCKLTHSPEGPPWLRTTG